VGPQARSAQIAHGYLVPALLDELLRVDGATQAINYGRDRARIPAPVPVGSRIRLTAAVAIVNPAPAGFRVGYT
jgi:acyl dehydratase